MTRLPCTLVAQEQVEQSVRSPRRLDAFSAARGHTTRVGKLGMLDNQHLAEFFAGPSKFVVTPVR